MPLFALLGCALSLIVSSSGVIAQPSGSDEAGHLAKKIFFLDIPSQSLQEGIVEFGLQANVNLIVPANLLAKHQSSPLYGRYSLSQALEILLSKTPFSYVIEGDLATVFLVAGQGPVETHPMGQSSGKRSVREIEDVLVVSARHRDEDIQDVPMSLAVFSGEFLELNGVPDLARLSPLLANTSLTVARGTNTTLVAYIRGIGQSDPLPGFESGVGIYIDDVYRNRPQGAVLDIYDVERIEVLRGPQGTLYGRNTIGGAIKYITKRLSGEPEFNVKGSLGSFHQQDLVVTAGAPVMGDLFRIGGSLASFNRGGFGENVETGEEHYDKDIVTARASVEIRPSSRAFVRLVLDHTRDKSGPKPGYRASPSDVAVDENGDFFQPLDSVFDSRAGATAQGHAISANNQGTFGFSVLVECSIDDELELRSILAFRDDEQDSPIDFDGLPGSYGDIYSRYESEQVSYELRLVYESGAIQGVAGFYYLDADAFSAYDSVNGEVDVTGIVEWVDDPGVVTITSGTIKTKAWAVFSEVNFGLIDTLDLSIGARYTSDSRSAELKTEIYLGVFSSPYFSGVEADSYLIGYFENSRTDPGFTPRVSINWAIGNVSLYSVYSRGFKGGGYNPRGFYFNEEKQKGFEPEAVGSYELGFKARFFDGGLTSNLAVFYSDYQNVQIIGSLLNEGDYNADGINDKYIESVTNDAEARIYGLEFDVTTRISDGFNMSLAVGMIDAEYYGFYEVQEINGDEEGVEYRTGEYEFVNSSEDHRFPFSPELTIGLSSRYRIQVKSGELLFLGGLYYSSRTYSHNRVNDILGQPGHTLFNVSVVWRSDGGRWLLGANGLNLSDKEYIVDGYSLPDMGVPSIVQGERADSDFYGNPRTVTATIKYSF